MSALKKYIRSLAALGGVLSLTGIVFADAVKWAPFMTGFCKYSPEWVAPCYLFWEIPLDSSTHETIVTSQNIYQGPPGGTVEDLANSLNYCPYRLIKDKTLTYECARWGGPNEDDNLGYTKKTTYCYAYWELISDAPGGATCATTLHPWSAGLEPDCWNDPDWGTHFVVGDAIYLQCD